MNLDQIITEKLTRTQIIDMKNKGEINKNEFSLLFSLDQEAFFISFLTGQGEYKIKYDNSVAEDLYFTNVDSMLSAFYTLYPKLPNYHFDKLLEAGLKKLSSSKFELYTFLTILNRHLVLEREGKTPFKIQSTELLLKAQEYLKDPVFRQRIAQSRIYTAKSNQDGLLGVYRQYNENFKSIAGVDILAPTEDNPQMKV